VKLLFKFWRTLALILGILWSWMFSIWRYDK
jgi:hypothetical protein